MNAIEIDSDLQATGDPISLDLPIDDSGAFAFERWPSACALADEKTLSAIFPQAEEILQEGSDRVMSVITVGEAKAREVTVPEADCNTKIGFPSEELSADSQNVVFLVTTTVESAGTPEFVDRNTLKKGGEEKQIGGATCVVSSAGLRYDCSTEHVSFGVTLDGRPYGQYFGESESSYVVDGDEQVFSGDVQPFLGMIEEKVLLPLVTADIERLAQ